MHYSHTNSHKNPLKYGTGMGSLWEGHLASFSDRSRVPNLSQHFLLLLPKAAEKSGSWQGYLPFEGLQKEIAWSSWTPRIPPVSSGLWLLAVADLAKWQILYVQPWKRTCPFSLNLIVIDRCINLGKVFKYSIFIWSSEKIFHPHFSKKTYPRCSMYG